MTCFRSEKEGYHFADCLRQIFEVQFCWMSLCVVLRHLDVFPWRLSTSFVLEQSPWVMGGRKWAGEREKDSQQSFAKSELLERCRQLSDLFFSLFRLSLSHSPRLSSPCRSTFAMHSSIINPSHIIFRMIILPPWRISHLWITIFFIISLIFSSFRTSFLSTCRSWRLCARFLCRYFRWFVWLYFFPFQSWSLCVCFSLLMHANFLSCNMYMICSAPHVCCLSSNIFYCLPFSAPPGTRPPFLLPPMQGTSNAVYEFLQKKIPSTASRIWVGRPLDRWRMLLKPSKSKRPPASWVTLLNSWVNPSAPMPCRVMIIWWCERMCMCVLCSQQDKEERKWFQMFFCQIINYICTFMTRLTSKCPYLFVGLKV